MKILSKKKPLPQPSEPATLAPIAEYHERKRAEERAARDAAFEADRVAKAVADAAIANAACVDYTPTRSRIDKPRHEPSSILRAVEKGGTIRLNTLKELLELLEEKTDYHFHIEVATQSPRSALLKTIDNERDALETIRRLKAKP